MGWENLVWQTTILQQLQFKRPETVIKHHIWALKIMFSHKKMPEASNFDGNWKSVFLTCRWKIIALYCDWVLVWLISGSRVTFVLVLVLLSFAYEWILLYVDSMARHIGSFQIPFLWSCSVDWRDQFAKEYAFCLSWHLCLKYSFTEKYAYQILFTDKARPTQKCRGQIWSLTFQKLWNIKCVKLKWCKVKSDTYKTVVKMLRWN